MRVFYGLNALTGMRTFGVVRADGSAALEVAEVDGAFILTVRLCETAVIELLGRKFVPPPINGSPGLMLPEAKWLLSVLDRGISFPVNELNVDLEIMEDRLIAKTRDGRVTITVNEEPTGGFSVTAEPRQQICITLNGEQVTGVPRPLKPISPTGLQLINWFYQASNNAPKPPSFSPTVLMVGVGRAPFESW